MEYTNIPFVEKYRPTDFDNIVLDPLNKQILKNIIETAYFPNLLFYGPPGTGKTTTIINLVNAYQEKFNQKNKGLMIHLNASDERGIDTIRNQINQFVNSKTLFNQGMKFVILDEVDYMTKNAQQALRYLLQNYTGSVRFCLICNYISRIDEGLQNEFLRLRFNQLPKNDTIQFLHNISVSENLNLDPDNLALIQKLYKSDIRSMINFMQTNQYTDGTSINIIDDKLWENLFEKITNECETNLHKLNVYINDVSLKCNVDKKTIIKYFFNYIVRNEKLKQEVASVFFDFVENITHFEDCVDDHYVNYSLVKLLKLVKL